MLKKIFRIVIIILTILVLLSAVLFFTPAWTPKIRDANGHVPPNSIASLEKVKIGGINQWILIRGSNKNNPVLLFLHGGPGDAQMSYAPGFESKLEKHFVVVNWDQRGSGKTYSKDTPIASYNINQYISDTHDLVKILRKRFNQDKIYLVGHSWGTTLGLLTVQRYPELFKAYIGVSQVVYDEKGDDISYKHLLDTAIITKNTKAIKELREIGPPPYDSYGTKTQIKSKWLDKFRGSIYTKSSPTSFFLKSVLFSTEYTPKEKYVAFITDATSVSIKKMWKELSQINFLKQVPEIKVPVYFCIGRHDYNCPTVLAVEYFKKLRAPKKDFIWFENSAHFPLFEEPDKFQDVLISKVLPETSN